MRVLVAHNFYQQPGGEDQVFRSELALLEARGHEPVAFVMHNDDIVAMGNLRLALTTVWNRDAASRLRTAVRDHRIDIVHFHNTFPLMSPAVCHAARGAGAAVVQTLHNFRLLCPGANLFRDGRVCEDCVGKSLPLSGIRHKCYRDNRAASAVTAAMLAFHRVIGTWSSAIDAFITPTSFAREKFIAGGLPADRIFVKPNFVEPDPGLGGGEGDFALFVGRLSQEKGLKTLLAAWQQPDMPPLKIVGDGPLVDLVQASAKVQPGIEWLGRRAIDHVLDLIGRAALLVLPSDCYETFGRVAVEAFAKGTPVVASGHGAPGDVVEHGRTGLHFIPSDSADLAAKVKQLIADPALRQRLREAGRREYQAEYTGAHNYDMLMAIYHSALARRLSGAGKDVSLAPVPAARV